MNNKRILVSAFLLMLLFINFVFRPFLHKREAFRVLDNVLALWEEGNIAESYKHFDTQDKVPPVSLLVSHEIIEKEYYKKDGDKFAKVIVFGNFGKNENLPKGEWVFTMKYTDIGWKVYDFYLLRKHN